MSAIARPEVLPQASLDRLPALSAAEVVAVDSLELQPLALLTDGPVPALLPPASASRPLSPRPTGQPTRPAPSALIDRLLKPKIAANWGLDAAGQITCLWQSLP